MSAGVTLTLKHSWIYFVATVINRAGGLLLLPLYAKTLSPLEFGAYAMIVIATDVLAVGLTSWLGTALSIVYFRQPDERAQKRLVSTALVTTAAISVGVVALSLPLGLATSFLLFGDTGRTVTVVWALSGLALVILGQVALDYFQIKKEPGIFLWMSVAKCALLLVANIVFLLVLDFGVDGIFISNVLAFGLVSAILLRLVLRSTGLAFSVADVRVMAHHGFPFLPTALLEVASGFAERAILNATLSTSAVGIYALGARLSQMLFTFMAMPFQRIWWIRRMEVFGTAEENAEANLVYRLFLVVLSTAALGLVLLTPELVWLIATPAYGEVAYCTPFLALASIAHGVRIHPQASLVRGGQSSSLPFLSGMSLAIGVVATVLLVREWGLVGAAAAHLIYQASYTAMAEYACRRRAPAEPHLNGGMLMLLLLLLLIFYAIGSLAFDQVLGVREAALKVLVALAFLVVATLSPIIGPGTVLQLVRGGRQARAFVS